MNRLHITLIAGIIGLATSCTPASRVPPTPGPATPEIPSINEAPGSVSYQFAPNTYRYRFQQTADIHGNGPTDTTPSRILTQGLFRVRVAAESDSSVTITISADSISITSQGSIPGRGLQQISTLDSVVTAKFSPSGVVMGAELPDSLCAYQQFTAMARELLLPELGLQTQSPTRQVYRDTVTQHACRAGTRIELVTVRQLRDRGRNPAEFSLEQETEIRGAGMLRRDSITVSGSVATRGTVSFSIGNRLPSLIQTHSEGRITVNLGSTTTLFHQRSTQEIRLEGIEPP